MGFRLSFLSLELEFNPSIFPSPRNLVRESEIERGKERERDGFLSVLEGFNGGIHGGIPFLFFFSGLEALDRGFSAEISDFGGVLGGIIFFLFFFIFFAWNLRFKVGILYDNLGI